jgi:hypothetical protein
MCSKDQSFTCLPWHFTLLTWYCIWELKIEAPAASDFKKIYFVFFESRDYGIFQFRQGD